MGIVEHFIQLEIDTVRAFQQPQAGQDLFVEMGLQVGKLGLFDAGQLFQQAFFVVIVQFIEGIE
jgi:hypothetical protein